MLGEHTDTVLRELLKRSESDIAQLRSAGVV
jgi:crotonobetainyl-CoA:carnitine CoA-transferase CaiB-like acyl-CoA transferase